MAQIVTELIKMANLIINIDKSLACMSRVNKILDIESSMEYTNNSPVNKSDVAIEFKNVTFTYAGSKEPCLSDINFKLNKGEILGVIGPTGSGKSSLINLVPRFYDVDSGEVLINGVNVKEYSKETLNGLVAIVPQKAALFKDSIANNLRVGKADGSKEEMWKALEISCAREIVENKDGELEHLIEQGGKNRTYQVVKGKDLLSQEL